jgi:hypothetical protein
VKSVKNFRYVEKTSAECNEDSYCKSRVELHCKLQEKLHRVTWPFERRYKNSVAIKNFYSTRYYVTNITRKYYIFYIV